MSATLESESCKALPHIHDKEDNVRRRDSNLRLLPHLGQDDVTAVRLNTAGIHQGKVHVQPGTVRVNTVSGYSRRILYDGDGLPCQYIEQG